MKLGIFVILSKMDLLRDAEDEAEAEGQKYNDDFDESDVNEISHMSVGDALRRSAEVVAGESTKEFETVIKQEVKKVASATKYTQGSATLKLTEFWANDLPNVASTADKFIGDEQEPRLTIAFGIPGGKMDQKLTKR